MDFLKKNWGLLLCIVAFLAILAFLVMKILAFQNETAETEKKIASDKAWFNKVNKDGWKVHPDASQRLENEIIATANKETATSHYEEMRRELYKRYSFQPRLPQNGREAQDMLNRHLQVLENKVRDNISQTLWQAGNIGGQLATLRNSQLRQEEFSGVFRQLMIYEKLLNVILSSKVKVITTLGFPKWLNVEDAGDYTVTPITVGVVGDSDSLQKLVNAITYDPSMLFFIRQIEFRVPGSENAENEYTPAFLQRKAELTSTVSDNGTGDNSNQPAAITPTTTRRGRRGRRSAQAAQEQQAQSTVTDSQGNKYAEEDLVKENPKRQNYLIFKTPRTIQLNLNLDLIEYKSPES